jgi:hypothetical protein
MARAESPSSDQRRVNHGLRELLDELIDHVRGLSSRREELTQEEIEYAQERLQWLADEVWRVALLGESDQS